MAHTDTTKPKTARWLKVVLFASLALNLLIAGLIVGAVASGGFGKKSKVRGDMIAPFTRALTMEQRREVGLNFRKTLRQKDRERGHGARLSEEFETAVTLIRAEPFDGDALAQLLQEQAERAQGRMNEGQKILAAYIAGMSAEERAVYADRLAAAVEDMGRKGRSKDNK